MNTSTEPQLTLSPGDNVDDKYRIVRAIGSGGAGTVFAATHLQLGELVALKVLHASEDTSGADASRLLREARSAARLKNEHITRILDVSTTGEGLPYLVMEFLDGRDLGEVLSTDGPVSPAEAVDYILQVCEAVAEAHAAGIVHRDLKPSNFFLSHRSDGSPLVKVLDFGIAKDAEPTEISLTQTRVLLGSPVYMSPEQLRSARRVDHRSDIWSLGVCLYELLSDSLPFEGDSVTGVAAAIASDPVTPLPKCDADTTNGLSPIIQCCLEKRPDDRFQSVLDLAEALAPYGNEESALCVRRIRGIAGIRSSDNRTTRPSYSDITGAHSRSPLSTARTELGATAPSVQPITSTQTLSSSPTKRFPLILVAAAVAIAILVVFFMSGSTASVPPEDNTAASTVEEKSTASDAALTHDTTTAHDATAAHDTAEEPKTATDTDSSAQAEPQAVSTPQPAPAQAPPARRVQPVARPRPQPAPQPAATAEPSAPEAPESVPFDPTQDTRR